MLFFILRNGVLLLIATFIRKVIGIDLGVAYSRVGVVRGENFEIIPDLQGRVRTPSYVSFLGNMVLVGEEAKALATFNSNNTFHDIRYMSTSKCVEVDTHSLQKSCRTTPKQETVRAVRKRFVA